MRLPALNEAEVPKAKIAMYLLKPEHRSGKSKAHFFSGHGFVAERWQALAEALRPHARENEIAKRGPTPLGERLVVEGPMALADGTVAGIRSLRFVEVGARTPRFVTSYPLKRRKLL